MSGGALGVGAPLRARAVAGRPALGVPGGGAGGVPGCGPSGSRAATHPHLPAPGGVPKLAIARRGTSSPRAWAGAPTRKSRS